ESGDVSRPERFDRVPRSSEALAPEGRRPAAGGRADDVGGALMSGQEPAVGPLELRHAGPLVEHARAGQAGRPDPAGAVVTLGCAFVVVYAFNRAVEAWTRA